MATNKNLRTPIIKPRTQGGTFYTFGSAMEDIGLNLNSSSNKVELSHYVLLDIPSFGKSSGELILGTNGSYSATFYNTGDVTFAEYFQDAILNMETVLRNSEGYNYASSKTVSERVFWKWLFKDKNLSEDFDSEGEYYYEKGNSIAKAFGTISSGSQRIDSYGIYNEAFVQIPSSYGPMRVLFKINNDENLRVGKSYSSSNSTLIEGLTSEEISGTTIKSTGISGKGIFSSGTTYECSSALDALEVEFDINKLRNYYDNSSLSYDDIAFGNVNGKFYPETSFEFNAILVYYSIYDSQGKNILSTNAFGLYILDNSTTTTTSGVYEFPTLNKTKTTSSGTGTSFSFRLNIKPTSAYSGDVFVSDNSTTAFSESTDFNDVIRNLSNAINILKTNTQSLYTLSLNTNAVKNLATSAIDKVNELEKVISSIKNENQFETVVCNQELVRNYGQLQFDARYIAQDILDNTSVTYNSDGKMSIVVNSKNLSGDAKKIADTINHKIEMNDYTDIVMLTGLLISSTKKDSNTSTNSATASTLKSNINKR